MQKVRLIGLDGTEIEAPINIPMLVAHLRQESLHGRKSVVVEVGAWRFFATLMGDTAEPLNQQLVNVRSSGRL